MTHVYSTYFYSQKKFFQKFKLSSKNALIQNKQKNITFLLNLYNIKNYNILI